MVIAEINPFICWFQIGFCQFIIWESAQKFAANFNFTIGTNELYSISIFWSTPQFMVNTHTVCINHSESM